MSLPVYQPYPALGYYYMTTYKDGASVSPDNNLALAIPPFITPIGNKGINYIAKNPLSSNLFDGQIDELEVSRVARDSSWIRLAYQTQRTNQTALCYPPAIAQPPHDTSVEFTDTARFSAVARGNNLQYKWLRSDNKGTSWTLIPGATGSQYKFKTTGIPAPGDTSATNYPRFRCVAYTPYDSAVSGTCTLTVCLPTAITHNPSSQTVFVGDVASFNDLGVSGRNLTYQWQRSDNGGTSWSTPSGYCDEHYVPVHHDRGRHECAVQVHSDVAHDVQQQRHQPACRAHALQPYNHFPAAARYYRCDGRDKRAVHGCGERRTICAVVPVEVEKTA